MRGSQSAHRVVLAAPVLAAALALTALSTDAGAGGGPPPGPLDAHYVGSSANGTAVFFETGQALVDADVDSVSDIYERSGGEVKLISTNTEGTAADDEEPSFAAVSADGTRVLFTTAESLAANDTDECFGLFGCSDVYERVGGVTTLLSTDTAGTANGDSPAVFEGASTDATRVFFTTAEELAATDDDICFGDGCQDVYERHAGSTVQVSTNSNEDANGARFASFEGASADGSRVFLRTNENLAPEDAQGCTEDSGTCGDVYMREAGETQLISTNTDETANELVPGSFLRASTDGSRVAFRTPESMSANDTDSCFGGGCSDIYVREVDLGSTTLVSTDTAGTANDAAEPTLVGATPSLGAIAFTTREALEAGDTDSDCFGIACEDVYQRAGTTTTQISTNTAGTANASVSHTGGVIYSNAGDRALFNSEESLAASDADACAPGGCSDVYERSGAVSTSHVSTNSAGDANAAFQAFLAGASNNGQRVFFTTSEALVASDTDDCEDGGCRDIYQRLSGSTTLVSTDDADLAHGPFPVTFAANTADGSRVFFETKEQLAPEDTDTATDVYVRGPNGVRLVSLVPQDPPQPPPDGEDPDTTPPDTAITKAAKKKALAKRKATFEFSATEAGATFECSLDDAVFAPCTSPHTMKKLKRKRHAFRVRAVDAAGNTDPTPAEARFKVPRKKKN